MAEAHPFGDNVSIESICFRTLGTEDLLKPGHHDGVYFIDLGGVWLKLWGVQEELMEMDAVDRGGLQPYMKLLDVKLTGETIQHLNHSRSAFETVRKRLNWGELMSLLIEAYQVAFKSADINACKNDLGQRISLLGLTQIRGAPCRCGA
ncbi:MAG: hypothetical protein PWQ91_885 [Eubacteriales bacterium]|nr:hypothetical protein [Eubacteriales bacterium]MDN5363824.1 hypothetical protein [Eubacteriales bacterium]